MSSKKNVANSSSRSAELAYAYSKATTVNPFAGAIALFEVLRFARVGEFSTSQSREAGIKS